ncbi:GDSL esterase/lipase 7 [Artemisia annua]|uniref:GDSL esterase/lipase 7 n=1 Tax=Artemisia annua TaxID=35608 RepID=A0A2U1NRZ6_ARTAN|nr:GDSL esterase/lipase 7 [Artemisia annua]
MDEQLNLFQKTIKEELEPIFDNPTELSQHLANSILIIWAGSNDYLLNYFNGLTPDYNTEEFAQLLIDRLSDKLEILHELGARKLVILEVGPLGCLPVYRKNNGQDETWCDDGKNINATKFNDRLAPMIQNLASTYPDSYFTLGKLYSLADHLFKHPAYYGMTNVSSSCCTTGKLFLNIACYSFWPPCANPQEYLFWDGAHPTEASFKILATPCFNGSDVCVPNNIQELVQAQTNGAGYLHSAA